MDYPWAKKPITFEKFMDFCLYDPEAGYYTNQSEIFGPQGDYYTSPYTHPVFADVLARAMIAYLRGLSSPSPADLVELGAGEGLLSRDLLAHIQAHAPDLDSRLRYHFTEVNRPHLPDPIRGVVFSNEFFDALPVHRVRVRDSQLREIYVHGTDPIREEEREISDPRILEYMKIGFPKWHEGHSYEVNLRMLDVLSDLDRRVQRGHLITIDYGFQWQEYDARPRPKGTLMCYTRHQARSNPYLHIGHQDLTAHVNFDVLMAAGERLGWRSTPPITQRQFLMQWGLEERLMKEEKRGLFNLDRMRDRLGLRDLLQAGGVCDTMKVLVQSIGCEDGTSAST